MLCQCLVFLTSSLLFTDISMNQISVIFNQFTHMICANWNVKSMPSFPYAIVYRFSTKSCRTKPTATLPKWFVFTQIETQLKVWSLLVNAMERVQMLNLAYKVRIPCIGCKAISYGLNWIVRKCVWYGKCYTATVMSLVNLIFCIKKKKSIFSVKLKFNQFMWFSAAIGAVYSLFLGTGILTLIEIFYCGCIHRFVQQYERLRNNG